MSKTFAEKFNEKYVIVDVDYYVQTGQHFTLAIPRGEDINEWLANDILEWDWDLEAVMHRDSLYYEIEEVRSDVTDDDIGDVDNLEGDELEDE